MDTAVVQKPERDNSAKRASQLTPDVQRRADTESGAGAGLPLFLQASSMLKGMPQIQRQVEEEEEEEEELIQPKLNVQTKLTVGAPDDKYEREADVVADKVMRMPAGGNELEDDLEKPPQIQSKSTATGVPPSITGSVTNTISSPGNGSPLDETVRSRVEPVLGVDLSCVRVHSGASAQDTSQTLNAKAFTHQNNIFLGKGQSAFDVQLMAHEATHVVQQGGGKSRFSADTDSGASSLLSPKPKPMQIKSVTPGIQRKTTRYDFEPDNITVSTYNLGGAGRRPYDVIQDHVSQVGAALGSMRTGELGAINQFLTHMSFSSSTEAQPDVLGAVFKYVGKQIWESAIGALPSVAGVSGAQIIGIISAMTDELERAAAAQQSYELATFITSLRSSTLTVYQNQIATLQTTARRDLESQFSAQEGIWSEGDTTVTGGKAQFLRELDQRGAAMLRAVPQPIQYEEALITRWITDRLAGGRYSGGRNGNGKIQLKYDTRESNGQFTYSFESAKLFTATKSGQAADMFTRVMTQQNKKVYELGVPVQVMLETEGMMPGGRSYYAFWIRSITDYDRSGIGWRPAERAWRNMSWEPIDQVRKIKGS